MEKERLDRRKFLKNAATGSAGAIGFPYLIPSSAWGASGTVAPSNRTVIGCIGLGGMGTGNLHGFLSKEQAQVVAVCDVDADHRNHARNLVNERYDNKDCGAYNDFRELLDRDDLDAVSLAMPDHWHAIPAIMAARGGRDIYAEKPLAYTIAEGRAIVDAVHRYGVIWQTGSWQRSQRHFRFACELVRNGRIGNVHTVHVGLPQGNSIHDRDTQPAPAPEGFDYDMWLGPAPWAPYCPSRCHWNFRWISDYSGGQLTDWAGHHCDIAQWGMGTQRTNPVEIGEAKGDYPKAEDGIFDTPNRYRFVCKFAEGFKMIVSDAGQHPRGMGVLFEGDEGWVYVNRGGLWTHPDSLARSVIGPNDIHLYESNDHHQNFLDCVRSRAQTITPVEVAHRSIMIAHLGTIAMKLGRNLHWDPESERFYADADANRLLSRPMRGGWHL